jgi:hypothetical protein
MFKFDELTTITLLKRVTKGPFCVKKCGEAVIIVREDENGTIEIFEGGDWKNEQARFDAELFCRAMNSFKSLYLLGKKLDDIFSNPTKSVTYIEGDELKKALKLAEKSYQQRRS